MALQQRIRECQTPTDVLAIVAVQGCNFDAIHSTTCLHGIAKMMVPQELPRSPIFKQLITLH